MRKIARRVAICLGLALVIVIAFACAGEDGDTNEEQQESIHEAYQKLADLEEQGIHVRYVDEQRTAEGDFHHLRVVAGEGRSRLGNKFAIDNNGQVRELSGIRDEFASDHYDTWGSLTLRTAQWMHTSEAPDVKVRRFSFWFDEETSHEELRSLLEGYSADDIKISDIVPITSFYLPVGQVVDLAFHEMTRNLSMLSDEPVDFQVNPSGVTSAHYTESADDYNDAESIFATDEPIGIVETVTGQDECGLVDEHDAFEFADVDYLTAPATCNVDADCAHCDQQVGFNNFPGECIDGTCRNTWAHAEHVASRISTSVDGERLHAAEANIVFSNIGANIGDPVDLAEVYDILHGQGVRIVNESWGFDDEEFEAVDFVRDWFVRNTGMTSVKASGNHAEHGMGVVDCHALNAVCVGGTNAEGTYGQGFMNDTMYASSAWENPLYSQDHPDTNLQGTPKDAQRPDVVSEGEDALVMNRDGGTDSWQTTVGTSFAAPVVSGLLALLDDDCGPFEPATHRAALRTAAYRPHDLEPDPDAPAYPTPGQADDARAGTGINHAMGMRLYCEDQPGQPELQIDQGTIDPTDDSSWTSITEYRFMMEEEFPRMDDDDIVVHPQPVRTEDTVVQDLWKIEDPVERVRVTFSWHSCPPSDNGGIDPGQQVDFIEPAVDFDIILCSESAAECIGLSESLDDTNEGFDVEVPNSLSQVDDWMVSLLKPPAEEIDPCGGVHGDDEPYGTAIAIWR